MSAVGNKNILNEINTISNYRRNALGKFNSRMIQKLDLFHFEASEMKEGTSVVAMLGVAVTIVSLIVVFFLGIQGQWKYLDSRLWIVMFSPCIISAASVSIWLAGFAYSRIRENQFRKSFDPAKWLDADLKQIAKDLERVRKKIKIDERSLQSLEKKENQLRQELAAVRELRDTVQNISHKWQWVMGP